MGDNPATTSMRGAIDSVRTQPGGEGGQAIVINFITVHSVLGKEGVKKRPKNCVPTLSMAPWNQIRIIWYIQLGYFQKGGSFLLERKSIIQTRKSTVQTRIRYRPNNKSGFGRYVDLSALPNVKAFLMWSWMEQEKRGNNLLDVLTLSNTFLHTLSFKNTKKG